MQRVAQSPHGAVPWGHAARNKASSHAARTDQSSSVRASQGASELGRGVQATAGETVTCGWAVGARGHLKALSRLETNGMQGSDSWEPQLSWGGVSLRSQALDVESVLRAMSVQGSQGTTAPAQMRS